MITNTLLSATGVDVFTASSGTAVVMISICNISSDDGLTFDLYVIPNGNAIEDRFKIISNRVLDATGALGADTFILSEKLLLSTGDKIHITASDDNKLAATLSYLPI